MSLESLRKLKQLLEAIRRDTYLAETKIKILEKEFDLKREIERGWAEGCSKEFPKWIAENHPDISFVDEGPVGGVIKNPVGVINNRQCPEPTCPNALPCYVHDGKSLLG